MANPLGRKLLTVEKPARYIGGEFGVSMKNWDDVELTWCLAFPEVYEIGMSHLGLNLIYNILNGRNDILADRVYAPWPDMEKLLRAEGVNLWGLATGRTLGQFDILGISIPYELTYTNIVSILKLGGMSPLANDRSDKDPIVIGGGAGAFNPEPVADFFDAILIGDGEEAVIKISDTILEAKKSAVKKDELLKRLSLIQGIYIPKFGREQKISRAVVSDLDAQVIRKQSIVSNIQLVHDRLTVEIQRGCSRGCRFCQAGMQYRPNRRRSPKNIISYLGETVETSGMEECGLLSLSTGDYDGIAGLICALSDKFEKKWVHVSLPSLRVESLNDEDVVRALSRSLKGGFTLAPEAATERLRRVINKGNTEDEFLFSVEKIFRTGWKNLKLYFMIGLPSETEEDITAIGVLVDKVKNIGRKYHKYPNITVNVSTFIPKAHTPFQWERQLLPEQIRVIHSRLRRMIKGPGLELKLHDPKTSHIEGVFARGDRKLSKAILSAYEKGCRFDAWSDHFKYDEWMKTFEENGIDPDSYHAEKNVSEELPWEHLFVELDGEFLKAERRKAVDALKTADCSRNGCVGCGVCDFKEVKPVDKKTDENIAKIDAPNAPTENSQKNHKYRIHFRKTGNGVFVGHNDMTNIFRRAFRRACLQLVYTEGFNPRSKISFSAALPVGVASMDEWCEVEIAEERDVSEIKKILSNVFPEGFQVTNVAVAERTCEPVSTTYKISFQESVDNDYVLSRIGGFYAASSIKIKKRGKKGVKEMDLRQSVISLAQIFDRVIEAELKLGPGMASITDFVKWFADGLENVEILKLKCS